MDVPVKFGVIFHLKIDCEKRETNVRIYDDAADNVEEQSLNGVFAARSSTPQPPVPATRTH